MPHDFEPEPIRLRPREAQDLAALADLWVASWREAFPAIDFAARRRWFLDHLAALESGGALTICAVGTDAVVTFGFVTIDSATGYLDQLAVAPSAKGRGVAEQLITEARRLAPGGIFLDVNQDNARAVRFYEREGFVRTGDGMNPRSGLKTFRLQWTPAPTPT